MNEEAFRAIAEAEWDGMPQKWKERLKNVALLVEDEPDEELRKEEGLEEGESLFGIYRGIPNTERGSDYGVGVTLPDTITLFRLPILDEAQELTDDHTSDFRKHVAKVVRETIWHEVGHFFGYDDPHLYERENEGSNTFNEK